MAKPTLSDAVSRLSFAIHRLKNCGAGGGPGKPGFQPGNTCAGGGAPRRGAGGLSDFLTPTQGATIDAFGSNHISGGRNILQLGDDVSDAEVESAILGVAGTPDNARVKISGLGDSYMMVRFETPTTKGTRILSRDNGKSKIENESLTVRSTARGQGLGTEVLAKQVAYGMRYGISEINTSAARGSQSNGYYTWARLGYDAKLSREQIQILAANGVPRKYRFSRVSDFMKTSEGRQVWKEHGFGKTMQFPLSKKSQSVKVLDEYVRQKAKAQG